jgi:hypothetical protein
MKTRYKYIYFEEQEKLHWFCRNNKTSSLLGHVTFYKHWRQWVFTPELDCIFSADCLADIHDFMGQL